MRRPKLSTKRRTRTRGLTKIKKTEITRVSRGVLAAGLTLRGVEVGPARTIPGSVNAMIVGYLSSAAFHNLAPASQQQYRRIFEGLRRDHGGRSIATLERRHVVRMVDTKAETPVAARDYLRCLRLLI